jgi:lipoprotein-anchoring transpeptidase ErfK/SrfK
MPRVARIAAAAAAILLWTKSDRALADILVQVNKASQRMSVIVDGEHRYTWAVSTGVGGTPSGTFRAQSLSRHHRSKLYGGVPMPYSIFYDGNYAIHGTLQTSRLGSRASRGCIRLHPANAAVLFSLVQKQGLGNMRVVVH